ncbi:MAG: hypothetical protein HY756_04510 [Nitrospirae bacterium]|nr:hypothetical protein [Nitrospirota bacterium]
MRFHELITSKNPAFGAAFVELVTKQDIRHIVLNPIDFSAFGFVEGAKSKSGRGSEIWEDYVYSLIEGKLAEDDLVLGIPPKEMARLVDAVMSEERGEEAYNRVIKAYLKRGDSRISRDLLISFILFLDALNTMLKEKFLFRAFKYKRDRKGAV